MPETVPCPACRRRLVLPDDVLGRQVRCPACQNTFRAEVSSAAALPVDDIPYAQDVEGPPGRRPSPHPWTDLGEGRGQPERQKSNAGWWVVGGLIGVVGLLTAGLTVAGLLWSSPKRRPSTVVRGTTMKRREPPKVAFSKPVPLEKPDPALNTLFTDLGQAMQKRDQARLQQLFDGERMADEVVDQGVAAPQGQGSRQALAQSCSRGLARGLLEQSWTSYEIRKIAWRGDKEAAVIVRHCQSDGSDVKMRWFLTRESGPWKVYDCEDLRAGLRVSTTAALVAKEGLPNAQAAAQSGRALREVRQAINRGDLDGADALLRQAQAAQLPRPVEGLILLLQAEIHLLRSQPQEALECLDRAERTNPNTPLIDLWRGVAHNQQGEWDKALKHLKANQEVLGDEEPVCLQLGEALRGKRRFAEAAAAYRKALDYNPKNLDAFLGLMYSLTLKDRRDDVPGRFARLDNRQEAFQTCVEALQQAGCHDAVEQLAEAMHRLEPQYTPAIYQLCLARARAGQWKQAVQLFRDKLARQKEPLLRRENLAGFLQALARVGKAVEGYNAAPEPREAFAILAAELKTMYRFDDLRTLVELHRTKAVNDSLLPFYQGEILLHEGKYAEADRAFTAGAKRPPDRATCEQFRNSRVRARYHTDRPLSAYDDIGPKQQTSEQLANLLLADGKHELLETLLAAHARTYPNDPHIAHFRLRAHIRREKVDEAIALFKAELARQLPKEQREPLVEVFLQEMAEAGRSLEAYRAAPDSVHAFKVLAIYLLDEDYDMESLEKLVAAHRVPRADDSEANDWLSLCEAEVLMSKKEWNRAIHCFEGRWPPPTEELRQRFYHRYLYALYRDNFVLHAYDTVPPRKETFEQLAYLLVQDKKGKELEELIAAHRPHAGDAPEVDYFAARASVLLGRYEQGRRLLEAACKKQSTEGERQAYVNQFCRDMSAAGKPLEAYRSAPNRQAAFATLAADLLLRKKPSELKALLDEHGKGGAKDWTYLRYRGELALLRGEPAQAEPLFVEALAKAPVHEGWEARAGLARARVRAGKAVAVYGQSGSKAEVFEELARLCEQEKDGKQLAALVAAHRREHPRDPGLPAWDLDAKWLLADYLGVCKLVTEHRQDLFAQPQYRWKADDYLVRSLVKLGRGAEAVKEVDTLAQQGRGLPVLTVLAHAAHEGAAGAIAAMEKPSRYRPNAEACYQDPDLGPLLRSEAFAAFRKKFPPAAKAP